MLRKDTPGFIEPCVPTCADAPPPGEQWQHEPKFDGWRCQAVKTGGKVRLFTRSGQDITRGASALIEMLSELRAKRMVLDGELISSNAVGVPDFAALTRALRDDSRALIFAAFDCLHLEGHDLKCLALERRRRELVRLIASSQVPVMVIPAFDDGALLLNECGRAGTRGRSVEAPRSALPFRPAARMGQSEMPGLG